MYARVRRMTVASPYAVFRAADLGWPPPITARNPQIGASVRNNPPGSNGAQAPAAPGRSGPAVY